MEFEIINEILTSTVANLFPNRSIHMSYFKTEDDTTKAEIPKSNSCIIKARIGRKVMILLQLSNGNRMKEERN